MGLGEGAGDEGGHQGDFEGGGRCGDDLGQFTGGAVAFGTAEHFQVPSGDGKARAAPHGADGKGGEGHTAIEAVGVFGDQAETDGVFRDAGGVLAGGQVDGGEGVGQVEIVAEESGGLRGGHGQLLEGEYAGAVQVQEFEDAIGQLEFDDDRMAAAQAEGAVGGFLVAVEPGFDQERVAGFLADPATSGVGGDGDHVLAGGVAGVVDEI